MSNKIIILKQAIKRSPSSRGRKYVTNNKALGHKKYAKISLPPPPAKPCTCPCNHCCHHFIHGHHAVIKWVTFEAPGVALWDCLKWETLWFPLPFSIMLHTIQPSFVAFNMPPRIQLDHKKTMIVARLYNNLFHSL